MKQTIVKVESPPLKGAKGDVKQYQISHVVRDDKVKSRKLPALVKEGLGVVGLRKL